MTTCSGASAPTGRTSRPECLCRSVGDGAMDNPESRAATAFVGRERLDNLVFVANRISNASPARYVAAGRSSKSWMVSTEVRARHRRRRHLSENRDVAIRLAGSVRVEQHDEWAVVRRSMSSESLAKAPAPPHRWLGRGGDTALPGQGQRNQPTEADVVVVATPSPGT